MALNESFAQYVKAQQEYDDAVAQEASANAAIKQAIEQRKTVGKRKEQAVQKLNEAKAAILATL